MDLIGKTTINPIFFYSGKILGYITWIILFLLMTGVDVIERILLSYNDYISYFIIIAALIFVVFSFINLGSSVSLGLPEENTVFKTNGIYKISRNPMYVGFNLMTISSIIYSLNIWIIFMGLYSIVIYHLIILGEEKFLENRFGREYLAYKKKVGRYL